jgi:hypothetical protein
MFFLEFGSPISRVGQVRPHGEWHFLVELCHWRFEKPESVLVGSEADPTFIDARFDTLKLGSVQKAEILAPSHDLMVNFSSGVSFKTFTTSREATDQWTQWQLFGPEQYVWISNAGGHLQCRKRDEPVRA